MMVNKMVFHISDDQLKVADLWRHILCWHISYFVDEDGFNGLLEHIGEENPFYECLIGLANSFGPGNPRAAFSALELCGARAQGPGGQDDKFRPNKEDNCERGAPAPVV